MSGISLQSGIIYGPVFSRRLGRSLGINLLPVNLKICQLDCVYCQYGPAEEAPSVCQGFPDVVSVLEALEHALKKPRSIDYLTFSGNGEPTLHPDFEEIVTGVRALRDDYRPDAKLAIFSNAVMVRKPSIRRALGMIDAPMMKLDAGNQFLFEQVNRPQSDVAFNAILEGLSEIPKLMIQSIFIDGPVSNVSNEALAAWMRVLKDLAPREIHIYSSTRPTAVEAIQPVSPQRLLAIRDLVRKTLGLSIEAFWRE